ncbi:MAG: GTP cyclohydrolase I FolE [Planctomycetes bacterium]|nr:GTP cyclohydrolase I FolE [Planctomycetota bacterium]MCB9903127.1 GTP cyclohydrolase I FolE [Planctomycetota bacterium]
MSTAPNSALREPQGLRGLPGAAELSTQDLIQELLKRLGEDPTREGLARTPERVSRSLEELTSGMSQSISEVIGQGVFEEDCSEMVIVKDIEFYSLCEHHMLPFYGRVHVAYIPNGKIIGLSKIPRIVDVFARRLQVQERMTVQIAQAIQEVLQPEGVGVVADAAHLCMMMRGVAKQNSSTMTSCLLGRFRSDARTRSEFLGLVRNMH